MQFDTALNVAWLLFGTLALAIVFWTSRRRIVSDRPQATGWFQLVGVAAIVAALFPYVSATDDVLRIEQFTEQQEHQQQSGDKSHSHNPFRLFEVASTSTVPPTYTVSPTLIYVEKVASLYCPLLSRSTHEAAGRSPPAAYAL